MTQPDEPSATLTDEEIRTHRLDAATAAVADDTGDAGDVTDSGDVTDTGDDAGDDS